MVVISWVLVVALLRWLAPAWDEITCDGDLAYLPAQMPSVVGERLLAEAFPYDRPKSQIAVYIAREDKKLGYVDFLTAYDLARRLKNLHGVAALARHEALLDDAERLRRSGQSEQAEAAAARAEKARQKAIASIDEAIRYDDLLSELWEKQKEAAEDDEDAAVFPYPRPQRLAAAYLNRALLNEGHGDPDQVATDRRLAVELDPQLAGHEQGPVPSEAARLPLLDVWTWQDDVFGKRLGSKHTRLILLQLSNEFMATDNIWVLDYLESVLDAVRENIPDSEQEQLQIGFSGSAAVGGDLLRSAKDSIRNTELFTVVLVILILGFVYRAPMLVAMPLITISVSLMAATALIALLTQLHHVPGLEWWDFKVFTTTRIFIVVILFGAGTDYFLFLASRYREELECGHAYDQAVSRSLAAVGDALAASALTTILGLATMFFADFGKFSNSGPAIGLCLAVTLVACVTLAPALLRAVGVAVFWPFGIRRVEAGELDERGHAPAATGRFSWLWERLARRIVTYPGTILAVCAVVLAWPAYHGLSAGSNVTYDFLRQLPDDRPSKQGAELMARHFPVGEGGPLTVVAYQPDGKFDTKDGRQDIRVLSEQLYVEGVTQVRSIVDPLGDFPPDRKVGLFSRQAWLKRMASPHPRTMDIFVATQGAYAGSVTRLDLILDCDPFSEKAERILTRVEGKLESLTADPDSPWHGATFAFAGIAASIRDLKQVTQSDNRRIQILVVLAVLIVLLVILRRPVVCIYMIGTVLFSYFVTIGTTEWFFAWAYGDAYQGLDWKVPLFLFVILVAIGQDYNVYLATRVFEEQSRFGKLPGLERAIVRTGGIITSCGVIMAGTFISMTSGTWGPALVRWIPALGDVLGNQGGALPAIVQLGFALALGVMLDTFIVRPILVPAFLALLARFWPGQAASA